MYARRKPGFKSGAKAYKKGWRSRSRGKGVIRETKTHVMKMTTVVPVNA